MEQILTPKLISELKKHYDNKGLSLTTLLGSFSGSPKSPIAIICEKYGLDYTGNVVQAEFDPNTGAISNPKSIKS